MSSLPNTPILFPSLTSRPSSSYWTTLFAYKLNHLHLDDTTLIKTQGYITINHTNTSASDSGGVVDYYNGDIEVDGGSLALPLLDDASLPSPPPSTSTSTSTSINPPLAYANERLPLSGHLQILNTLTAYKDYDKNFFLQSAYYDDEVKCLVYADLKKHTCVFWFAYVTESVGEAYAYGSFDDADNGNDGSSVDGGIKPIGGGFKELSKGYTELRLRTGGYAPKYFVILNPTGSSLQTLDDYVFSPSPSTSTSAFTPIFAFLDPSTHPTSPGWPLRNLLKHLRRLTTAGKLPPSSKLTILSYRPTTLRRLTLENAPSLPNPEDGGSLLISITTSSQFRFTPSSSSTSPSRMQVTNVGYEPHPKTGVPSPRTINLSPLLDVKQLATSACDLNLKLMRWRALPNLNLPRLKSVKVLLIGAGTLGCNVARVLVGWGVRNVTFFDSGKVSYSNPVRQPLFTKGDCGGGGRMKAVAAADGLKDVIEEVNSVGVVGRVVMPGHPFGSNREESIEEVERLVEQVREHDVVFVLTDTRESRWLPTLVCADLGRLCINVALGLDSYLVVRHGTKPKPESSDDSKSKSESNDGDDTDPPIVSTPTPTSTPSSSPASSPASSPSDTKYYNHTLDPTRLSCYFCSDITPPQDSTKNQTLDQQCTVTRPGLAPIASAFAVEVMVAMLHRDVGNKPGLGVGLKETGEIPHIIRGTVGGWDLHTPKAVPSFSCCTACSWKAVGEYRRRGVEFVEETCGDLKGGKLEEIVGLGELKRGVEKSLEEGGGWDEEGSDDEDF